MRHLVTRDRNQLAKIPVFRILFWFFTAHCLVGLVWYFFFGHEHDLLLYASGSGVTAAVISLRIRAIKRTGEPMSGFAKNIWNSEQLAGLTPSMASMLRRLGPMNNGSAQTRVELARAFEKTELSSGPVRAVLGASFKGCPIALLVVTDLDVVAFGQGYGNDQEYESIVIAKEWISEIHLHWGVLRRVRIILRDGPHDEREILFKGNMATADIAEQWRLAALDIKSGD